MSYRFVRVTNYYPQYIQSYYAKNSESFTKGYTEQYNHLINDSLEIVSSYSKSLNKIGIEAYDIISNAKILQNTWRKENNIPQEISFQELIIEQVKFYKPDVVWLDDFTIINKTWKNNLLKQVPSVKLLIGHVCMPYNSVTAEKFRLFDIVFTCIPCFEKELKKLGINTYLLYHGFETSILEKIRMNNSFPETNFVFTGSLYTGSGFHKSRIEHIEKMLQSGIEMDLYCNLESQRKIIAKKSVYLIINFLKKIHLENLINKISVLKKYQEFGDVPIKFYSKKLLNSSKLPVFGYEMYQLLSKAKICFNIHIEVAQKCAGNMRLFEATGVGTCLVTDWKENIQELFLPEKEIITYKNSDECIEKVKWLINNPNEREKIAKAGQQRTLKEHTIENRVKLLNEIILKELHKIKDVGQN